MIFLQAGYIIDELLIFSREANSESNTNQFEFSVIGLSESIFTTQNLDLTFATIHNLVCRGIPTRASKFLTEKLLQTNYSIKNSEIFYDLPKKEITNEKIEQTLNTIAQLQKVLLLFFAQQNNNFINKKLKIYVEREKYDCANFALEDIKIWFNGISILREDKRKFPKFELSSEKNDSYDIAIYYNENITVEAIHNLHISNDIEKNAVFTKKMLTTTKITYKSIGQNEEYIDQESNSEYKKIRFSFNDTKKEEFLTYFLQSVFRKENFRSGQLAILNRVLQGKDVIGLLPTGGGKSLTYQFAGLLQPAITVIIDPINSLMRDQYDKLIENHITATAYINGYNTPDERTENEKNLSDGELLFCFISPERLQIQRFRDVLTRCKDRNTFYGYAVIDEAHCVSEWGHDFRYTYLSLATNLKKFCPVQDENIPLTLFGLTATASYDVLSDIQRELNMNDDAIQSLPAEQIDRKELNFNLVKIENSFSAALSFWELEKEIGILKYPEIKKLINQIPQKLDVENFYLPTDDNYLNSGIIFCPTKSDKLPNGVLALLNGFGHIEGLIQDKKLEIVTFFSSGDDNSAVNTLVEEGATQSFDNQTKFINNKANLMLATKAFGMGIDKPNIRFTIHYSLPSSVESFYQEAGRAGRNRQKALCTILYSNQDQKTNQDFLINSFKGERRETAIATELLEEVEYEDEFYINYINSILTEEYNFATRFSCYINKANTYLYVQTSGKWVEATRSFDNTNSIKCGYIKLSDLTEITKHVQHITPEKASPILELVTKFLREFSPTTDYLAFLNQTQKQGLETMIKNGTNFPLIIGFANKAIDKIEEAIKNENVQDITFLIDFENKKIDLNRLARAAYNFCWTEEQYIANLKFEYTRATRYIKKVNFSTDLEKFIKEHFWKIRNSLDTQKLIYRLSILGVVDDYTIDYRGKAIVVYFSEKSEDTYKNNFSNYLLRYVGEEKKNEWLTKTEIQNAETSLRNYLHVLNEFVYSIIFKKRKMSIQYVQMLCDSSLKQENPDEFFREDIILYFTSKFAKLAGEGSLSADTDAGKIEDIQIIKRYIGYINEAPDGLGDQISNLKHLKAACARLRTTTGGENSTIELLNNFVLLALESLKKEESYQDDFVIEMLESSIFHFSKISTLYTYSLWLEFIEFYIKKLNSMNSKLTENLEIMKSRLIITFQYKWIRNFNQNFIDIPL